MTHRGYIGQVYDVRPVLAAMEDRGLPIDDSARIALGQEFKIAQESLGMELAALAPVECCRVHPKQGYKGIPPEVKTLDPEGDPPERLRFKDSGADPESYHYEQRQFAVDVPIIDAVTGNPVNSTVSTLRWCRVYDFNPNSSQQLLSYMKLKGHAIPKSKEEDDEGNQKDTTAKKELVRLAVKTGDTFYLKVIEFREFTKMRGTYIDGFAPGPDGRVHPAFTFDTGTGQLTARNPNTTNFPKHIRLAKQVRTMVAAPPGHILVEWDFKSYHVLTTGYCAEDASYMRMARLDMHSFVAGHALRCWDAGKIIGESDDALLERFAWLKSDPAKKRVRDKQAKPTILGVGFGMGYRRLYQENLEHFSGEKEARRFWDLLRELFPKVFAWQQHIRKLAHEQQYLKSPFGHIRRFYEVFRWDAKKGDWAPGDQAEEAVAFLPANIAFGNIRETMKDLAAKGLDERYGLCNHIHDSFLFCFPEKLLENHIADVRPVLTAPSGILRNPVVAPGGLVVDSEANRGERWSDMQDIKLPKLEASHVEPVGV